MSAWTCRTDLLLNGPVRAQECLLPPSRRDIIGSGHHPTIGNKSMLKSQLNGRVLIVRQGNLLEVTIRAPRTWVADAFFVVWSLGWTYLWCTHASQLFATPMVLLFGSPLAFVAYAITWHVCGVESVRATAGNGLVIERRIRRLILRHTNLASVSSVRPLGPRLWNIDGLFWNIAGGEVLVKSADTSFRFGIGLSQATATALSSEITAHLFGHAHGKEPVALSPTGIT
jgi:hypothetical protein